MRIKSIALTGIRCFENTGAINLSGGCNIFVGQNNAGKSTLLKSVLAWQGFWLHPNDVRPEFDISMSEMTLSDIHSRDKLNIRDGNESAVHYVMPIKGNFAAQNALLRSVTVGTGNPVFLPDWPNNFIVPFAAKRKAVAFDQSVSMAVQQQVTGTFANLYSRIDMLATAGRSTHGKFRQAVQDVVGLEITTKAAANGKEAGFYFDDDNFVTLDRMGDGVSEMVALIVELCLAKNKLFILEEPETNLHPAGLKALLQMVRESAAENQFMIATHSNIVVRELAAEETTKVFRVYRDGDMPSSPSKVREVERTPAAHMALLRELGYEFADFDLHDGWLFLEESSAESVFRRLLIPWFAPELIGRLRTFAAGGVANLEPTVAEFQRLVTFIHLQPVYEGRLWVRADGDEPGQKMIQNIRTKFPHLTAEDAATFEKAQFELYYPERFQQRVAEVLAVSDKQVRRTSKAELLKEVLDWSLANEAEAKTEWEVRAEEQIVLLKRIAARIAGA